MASERDLSFTFEERRTVQACAILIRKAGGKENYTKLLKLLYLADRASLIHTGRPITGASFVSMKLGPVLNEVYECIKGEPEGSFWDRHIRTDVFDVVLTADPGDDQLSDYDVRVLAGLAEKYAATPYERMIDIVHRLCPEWRDPAPAKVASLSAADVLRAAGEDDEAIADQAKQAAYHGAVRRLLHSS